ncbi:hypothetical protein UCDDS831_g05457 [Diplodia seriata]|uniref:Uncharacterized protein n=1 Tax=Diplodia seriata TaxID=420778 RepID=A0A0G2G661_9PEZI|nr:hypothetical protein UCDDS831_g05457 [Diplodia seriata]
MLSLVNPRPTATSDGPRNNGTLPRHLLSGRNHGPDAGRAPRRLVTTKSSDNNGNGTSSAPHHTMMATGERDADGDSFDNVFLGFDDDNDDDAIPLVPLPKVRSSNTTTTTTTTPTAAAKGKMKARGGGEEDKENDGAGRSGKRRRRVYRYVSHGIGGAGNFREY